MPSLNVFPNPHLIRSFKKSVWYEYNKEEVLYNKYCDKVRSLLLIGNTTYERDDNLSCEALLKLIEAVKKFRL